MQTSSLVTFRFALHCLMFHFLVVSWAATTTAYEYDGSPGMMRAIRRGFGFKQYGLQTARGFGKRGGVGQGFGEDSRDFVFSPYGSAGTSGEEPLSRFPDQPSAEGFAESAANVQGLGDKTNAQKIQAIWALASNGAGQKAGHAASRR